MNDQINPKRVQINNEWHDVSSGWGATLDLKKWMSPTKYTARIAYAHINNLFFVYDENNNKVGEFHTTNKTWSGCVTNIEV